MKKIQISGFTLIELAIVLVIIGLIIGGVLVGKDMIEAAKLNATITQINRYSQAVYTFRLKYELPAGRYTCNASGAVWIFGARRMSGAGGRK